MSKLTYLFSFVYGWAFPAMVPVFAMLFGVVDTQSMWNLEYFFYSKNGSDTYLFDHFGRLKLVGNIRLSYKSHPYFAGFALLLSYLLMYTLDERFSEFNIFCCISYIISSSFLAYWGSKLVPTMYGNKMAKEWTLLQSQLLFIYNAVLVVALFIQMVALRNVIVVMSFSLLVCAGILERAYVLFVLPLLGLEGEIQYRKWYSIQFKVAVIASFAMTSVLLLVLKSSVFV